MEGLDAGGLTPIGQHLDIAGLIPLEDGDSSGRDVAGLTPVTGWGGGAESGPAPAAYGAAAAEALAAPQDAVSPVPGAGSRLAAAAETKTGPVQLAQSEPPTPVAPAALQGLIRAGALTQTEAEEIARTAQTMRAGSTTRLRTALGFSPQGRAIILDDNMSRTGLADELRAAGFNVRTVREIFGRVSNKLGDEAIDSVAEQIDAMVLTRDKGSDLGGGFGHRKIYVDSRVSSAPSIIRMLKWKLGQTP